MSKQSIDHGAVPLKALVIHPLRPAATPSRTPAAKLEEAAGLAVALDLVPRAQLIAPLRAVTPATLFGKGKVEELRILIEADGLDIVMIDDGLTPVQQRNLEKAWQVKVVDRTGVILEIFARRARTREGRLQVELARLDYERSRLVRTWTHLERQRGGLGKTGGPGETQIELDRRLIAGQITKLKKELEEVGRTRALHRGARQRAPYPTIALVGYTNAGKSTLFNRLTEAKVVAKDMLFATLDPTVRQLKLPDGRPAMLSDTVGFISDLPHELVEAFRATLEEVREADIVLHVRDIAGESSEAERADVEAVLAELKLDEDQPVIEVWNKADRLSLEMRDELEGEARMCGAVLVSARTGEGSEALLSLIASRIDDTPPVNLRLAASQGEALAWLYRHARVSDRREAEDGGCAVTVRMEAGALGRFERLFPDIKATI